MSGICFVAEDILEEDALNEKACMQVLKIWIDKADEDIMQLEEDTLMLQCHQLAWDDEQWSNKCSAALREKISRLDLLMESLKKDDRENGLQSETEELPPRLHDLLKPLLESYLAKSKQVRAALSIFLTTILRKLVLVANAGRLHHILFQISNL